MLSRLLFSQLTLRTSKLATTLSPFSTLAIPSSTVPQRLLVIGCGVGGCSTALTAAAANVPVTILSASPTIADCNSWWAQGGIIHRDYNNPADTVESLSEDIHVAGAGLCDPAAVSKLATLGPPLVIKQLLTGRPFTHVPFDITEEGELAYCLEASHAVPRIIHYKDKSGMQITKHMQEAVLAHPNITVLTSTVVTDLVQDPATKTVTGAQVYNTATHTQTTLAAPRGTVLASGGLAGIYQHSTNPDGFNALGSSVALATRADGKTRDLEFVQFHPTALYMEGEPRFLLSETLRGEGAVLKDSAGHAYAKEYHEKGELAPRDIVARANFMQGRKMGATFLDISHREEGWLRDRFPGIDEYLRERGLDLAKDQLPCVPAAHYTCGGVETDLVGKTSLRGLFACGEAARTGLHGGNRLASTSLLEGIVWGDSVAKCCVDNQEVFGDTQDSIIQGPTMPDSDVVALATSELAALKRVMWDNVGIVRTTPLLTAAVSTLTASVASAAKLYERSVCLETIMLRDASTAGLGVAKAALANEVSQGTHYLEEEAEAEAEEEAEAEAAEAEAAAEAAAV